MSEIKSIADMRRDYTLAGLRRADLDADPIRQFMKWFDQAVATSGHEANAMTMASADSQGRPSSRTVLLKQVDQRGFTFFTNYDSRKGIELESNPHAALTFFWQELERQVCVSGRVVKVSREESEKYFNSRPRGSRLAAWASGQSEIIKNREVLEKRLAEISARYPDENIPTPPHWGGFCVTPERIEFWQGRPSRLHDRFEYLRSGNGNWIINRLSP